MTNKQSSGAARVAAAAVLGLLLGAGHAGAWGSGHLTQARMVLAALPSEIRDFFPEDEQQNIVRKYCSYPDRARSFDEALLGREAVDELARVQTFTAGRLLHDELSTALVFELLTRAFADRNPRHAAVWIGSLIHTIGDAGSHLPLTAYARPVSRFNIQASRGHGDLSLVETPVGRTMVARMMADYTPRVMADQPGVVLPDLILLPYLEMDYGAQRQHRIAGIMNADDPAAYEDGIRALAELGCEGAQRAADAVVTAWAFARQEQHVELTEALIVQGRQKAQAFCAAKPLAHDAVYAGTLDSRPAGPAVGVLLEPSTFMGSRRFSYSGWVTSAQIMRALRNANVPYRPIDIRNVDREGLPAPSDVPVLVVVAGSFRTDDAPFRTYTENGGRMLWIAGRDKGLLGKLSDVLQPVDADLVPVSLKYGDANTAVVARVSVTFTNEWAQALGTEPRRFVNNPNLRAWVQPKCDHQVVPGTSDIRVLASVTDGNQTMHLAAAWMQEDRARHVFMPEYLLVPYVLSHEQTVDFREPTLDAVGRPLLLRSLRMLAPDLVARK